MATPSAVRCRVHRLEGYCRLLLLLLLQSRGRW